jgi:C1A family cysteine protease
MTRKYGWKPQTLDDRDRLFLPAIADLGTTPLPKKIDLSTSEFMPPVWDQDQLGSCTAHAACAGFIFDQNKQSQTEFDPSRLELYYAERDIDGDVTEDGGSSLRTSCKALATVGVCRTDLWPYDESKVSVKPPLSAYDDALLHKAIEYASVPKNENAIKAVLASGFPIIFGTLVYSSIESSGAAKTGVVVCPQFGEQTVGGHALLLVGYDDEDKDPNHALKFRNSWGVSWGQKGYGQFSWGYFNSYASDLWVIRVVEHSG